MELNALKPFPKQAEYYQFEHNCHKKQPEGVNDVNY